MTQKYFKVEHYVNLYKLASQITQKSFIGDKPIIIFSNCLSLIAGLSFNAIKQCQKSIHIFYEYSDKVKQAIGTNSIVLIGMNLDEFQKLNLVTNEWTYYFDYIGNEGNVLVC